MYIDIFFRKNAEKYIIPPNRKLWTHTVLFSYPQDSCGTGTKYYLSVSEIQVFGNHWNLNLRVTLKSIEPIILPQKSNNFSYLHTELQIKHYFQNFLDNKFFPAPMEPTRIIVHGHLFNHLKIISIVHN